MAELEQLPKVTIEVTVKLSEAEARALNELVSFSADSVIKEIAPSSLGRHKDGLNSLFESVRKLLPPILRRADAAKTAFYEEKKP